jgi:hypothetical protein
MPFAQERGVQTSFTNSHPKGEKEDSLYHPIQAGIQKHLFCHLFLQGQRLCLMGTTFARDLLHTSLEAAQQALIALI